MRFIQEQLRRGFEMVQGNSERARAIKDIQYYASLELDMRTTLHRRRRLAATRGRGL